MKNIFENSTFKKVAGILAIAGAGIAAVVDAIGDQRKEKEFEEMKKAIKELQGK